MPRMDWLSDLPGKLTSGLYTYRIPVLILSVAAFLVFLFIARRRGWFAAARRHPGRTTVLAVALLAIGIPVGWYLGSPLFIRTSLQEPIPSASPFVQPSTSPTAAPSAPAGPVATDAPTAAPPSMHPPRTGEFHGTDEFHFGRGTATLIETAPGTWIVRFEDFSVRNGPDLYVYLSPDPEGYTKDAIELGTLKATDGNFNYDVPAGTDLAKVRSVLIWCKQFSHLFAVAPLS